MKRSSAVLLLVSALFAATPSHAQYVVFPWTLREFQPDIPNGGRANTIAVHPVNDDNIIVASETGGLFQSTNRGATWVHIDSLPHFSMSAVVFVPAHPDVVIATTGDDFRSAGGGGIWRSTDGGATWTQMVGPPPPSGAGRLAAYETSIAPDTGTIYVGTEYGVSISVDEGATWTHVDPFGPPPPGRSGRGVVSVTAQNGGRVIAAGPRGMLRSTNGGATWVAPTSGPGPVSGIHALGRSPFSPNDAYVVNRNTELWYTEDSGDHWTKIQAAPSGGGLCGGIPFVKANGHSLISPGTTPKIQRAITLYAGNQCAVWSLTTPFLTTATTGFDYTGTWTLLTVDHTDARDLAFTSGAGPVPLLLATDGGLHNTTDGGASWHLVGGGRKGYNALQVTEVKDQWITALSRHDLYFGTQDNKVWASSDDGVTWTNSWPDEGFFIEREHRVPTATDSKTTFVACFVCRNFIADPALTNVTGWPDATTPPTGNPKIVRRSLHVQGVDSAPFLKGLAVSTNLGTTWSQYATMPEFRRDLPKLSDPGLRPVLYQGVRVGFAVRGEIDHLARIVKNRVGSGATVTYPLMNNFGGLGINPTMFAWYQVFGVDPGDALHVIAPDVFGGSVKETWDGGDNWAEIPNLTSQVTAAGSYLFSQDVTSLVSAISFSPDDPRLVALGTWQNGLFVSGDRGATWGRVPNSERTTHITSIEWRDANHAVVSTYGRGLWLVYWYLLRSLDDFEIVCRRCIIQPFEPLIDPAERFTQALLVFNGLVQGGKIADGRVQELFVSPGSSVVFFTGAKEMAVNVTETTEPMGFGGEGHPAPPDGQTLRGLTLDASARVLGFAFSDESLEMFQPTANEDVPVGRLESPTAGKPYLELEMSEGSDSNRVPPLAPLAISARSFEPNTFVEIVMDDQLVQTVSVNDNGTFTATIIAPREFGLHSLTARDAPTDRVIDGAMFLVVHDDNGRDEK